MGIVRKSITLLRLDVNVFLRIESKKKPNRKWQYMIWSIVDVSVFLVLAVFLWLLIAWVEEKQVEG